MNNISLFYTSQQIYSCAALGNESRTVDEVDHIHTNNAILCGQVISMNRGTSK